MVFAKIILTVALCIAATSTVYIYAHYVGYAVFVLLALGCGAVVAGITYSALPRYAQRKRIATATLDRIPVRPIYKG
jgi:hypothetical protein